MRYLIRLIARWVTSMPIQRWPNFSVAAQARLHPALISPDAWRVIEIARSHGAAGWKVNGAGGDGGSVTILCGEISQVKRAIVREIEQDKALFKNIPVY
jgi:D-glycero-alpha-D-manno-heptose-7-phosphate kinase